MNLQKINYQKTSKILQLHFANGETAELSAEFLRVHSPSAEVQGHGKPVLVANKKAVTITAIQPVGHYAIKLVFDDGHDSGFYRFDYLYQLHQQQAQLWQRYLDTLKAHKLSREPLIPIKLTF